jgi:membrane protein
MAHAVSEEVTKDRLRSGAEGVLLQVRTLRRAVFAAMEHDVLTLGQATAYSAMVALFPALIVAAAVVSWLPYTLPLRMQMSLFFDRVLPSNVAPLLDMYFSNAHAVGAEHGHTVRALLSSLVVSLAGASSVMATLMEGFRRAYDLPLTRGSFVARRSRAIALVPLSLLPMTAASVLVMFGRVMTDWLAAAVTPSLRLPVLIAALVLRWTIALAGSVGIIAVIYHLGTDLTKHMREHLEPLLREPWRALRKDWSWRASLPGAAVATVLWLVSTLLFGYYVTRYANYSRVYGSLGTAIALLFWLYIIALSVLVGAEFNAQRASQGPGRRDPKLSELLWKLPRLHRNRTGRITD